MEGKGNGRWKARCGAVAMGERDWVGVSAAGTVLAAGSEVGGFWIGEEGDEVPCCFGPGSPLPF